MVQSNGFLHTVFIGCMMLLATGVFLCLIRAITGKRFTDRVVAINMIGTMTVVFICILSVYLEETYLVDVALVYTLLSFLAVVVLCRVVTVHHKGRLLHKEREEQKNG